MKQRATRGRNWSHGKVRFSKFAEEENVLWESRVIGDHNPLKIERAVFFYVGKAFCLRGGQEQRNLKPLQFVRSFTPECCTYVDSG